jgi:hypothetical protein
MRRPALRTRGRRLGEQRALEPVQQRHIVEVITTSYPDEWQLPYQLWNHDAVATLVALNYGIRVTAQTAVYALIAAQSDAWFATA